MILKVLSGILILVTAYLGVKHGWTGISNTVKPAEAKVFNDIGLTRRMGILISLLSIVGGLMVLLPKTFLIGNLVNAAVILFIMSMALRSGVWRLALIEIPFLIMPMMLIFLKHPLQQ